MQDSLTDIVPTHRPLAINVQGLHFTYSKKAAYVVDIPSWQVVHGTQVFLKGPSGSGKSTLLNVLAGILLPTSGTVEVLGQNLSQLSARRRDRYRAAHIGLVFQQFNLIPYLHVSANILLAAHFNGQSGERVEVRMRELLNALHLPDALLAKPASMLSVGQQQRVAIVRALINDPEVLIVDEPTSSLDADARDAFMNLLLQLVRADGKTLIFVSHDQSLAHYFDNRINLADINHAAVIKGTSDVG